MAEGLNIGDLLKNVPIGDIASKLGIDADTATKAVQGALPGLLGGMAVNASTAEGADALTNALKQHEGQEIKSLDDVDTEDGAKIVNHVLGDKQDAVAQALGAQAGPDLSALIPKLLPVLAPIVMAFLAKQNAAAPAQSGGGIGDLLGGLLGGGQQQSNQGGGLGDLLGGLLGGGQQSNQGGLGNLGSILGGLLK